MTEHRISTGCQAGPGGQWAYWAKCSCGWEHRRARSSLADALADAEKHWREQL